MCVCGMVWSWSGMALDHGLSFSGVSSCCQEGGGFGPQVKQNAMLWAGVFFGGVCFRKRPNGSKFRSW